MNKDPRQAPDSSAASGELVSRCICFNVSFADILEMFEAGENLGQIHTKTGFGAQCSLCVPYIIRACQMKSPNLPVMWADDFRKAGISPGAIQSIEAQLAATKSVG